MCNYMCMCMYIYMCTVCIFIYNKMIQLILYIRFEMVVCCSCFQGYLLFWDILSMGIHEIL